MPMKEACRVHDRVNLFILPILGFLTSAGLLGWVDPVKVTILFTWYIVADFTWILVEPDSIPSLPNVILLHHVVTFILLCFPLRHAGLATFTCWDGICEINTFFLIARRQWRSLQRPFSFLYWATFFPLRIFLYPLMLVKFYYAMQQYAVWELVTVCSCQVMLIAFNFVLLALSVANWQKRAKKNKAAAATIPNAAETADGGMKASGKGGAGPTRKTTITAAAGLPAVSTRSSSRKIE